MSESLPTPASTDRVTTGALDPTAVVLGPRPVQPSDTEETKVIVGEVLQGRHRAPRARRRGTGPVGAAVLSATGIVAGLSLLLNHDSTAPTAAPEPVSAAPDRASEEAAAVPVAATAAAPVGEGELALPAPHPAAPATATHSAAAHPAHPDHGQAASLKDWLKQLRWAAGHPGGMPGPGGYPRGGTWGPGPETYPGPGGDAGPMAGWPGWGQGGD